MTADNENMVSSDLQCVLEATAEVCAETGRDPNYVAEHCSAEVIRRAAVKMLQREYRQHTRLPH